LRAAQRRLHAAGRDRHPGGRLRPAGAAGRYSRRRRAGAVAAQARSRARARPAGLRGLAMAGRAPVVANPGSAISDIDGGGVVGPACTPTYDKLAYHVLALIWTDE